jgi:hypothetical protein
MGKMFDLLKEGLEEAIAYERGLSKNVRVKKVRIDTTEIPQHPKEYQAEDIKHLRDKLNCSQNLFAAYLNDFGGQAGHPDIWTLRVRPDIRTFDFEGQAGHPDI